MKEEMWGRCAVAEDQHLARLRVERDDVATLAGHRDQLAVDIRRGRPRCAGTEAPGVEPPEQSHLLEVVTGDLGGWCVARMPRVAAQVGPLAAFDPGPLRAHRGGRRQQGAEHERERDHAWAAHSRANSHLGPSYSDCGCGSGFQQPARLELYQASRPSGRRTTPQPHRLHGGTSTPAFDPQRIPRSASRSCTRAPRSRLIMP